MEPETAIGDVRRAQVLAGGQEVLDPAGDQRSTTESTEIHGKENPNQVPLSVSFPGAGPRPQGGEPRP